LVHEAYVRLVDTEKAQRWNSRGHFFGAAAEAMRRILVEQARRKRSLKQGGQHQRRDIELDRVGEPETADEVLAIHDALDKLARENAPVAKLVELRYFGGLTLPEAASACGVSDRTAHRYWAYAKAWLHDAINTDG
jgi:RNA polymerase sigma factor (TIGR02999 family)